MRKTRTSFVPRPVFKDKLENREAFSQYPRLHLSSTKIPPPPRRRLREPSHRQDKVAILPLLPGSGRAMLSASQSSPGPQIRNLGAAPRRGPSGRCPAPSASPVNSRLPPPRFTSGQLHHPGHPSSPQGRFSHLHIRRHGKHEVLRPQRTYPPKSPNFQRTRNLIREWLPWQTRRPRPNILFWTSCNHISRRSPGYHLLARTAPCRPPRRI